MSWKQRVSREAWKARRKRLDAWIFRALQAAEGKLPDRLRNWVVGLYGGRIGIGSRIATGLAGGAILTLVSIAFSLILMTAINIRQNRVTEGNVPALAAAFDINTSASELVLAVPTLLTAEDAEALDAVREDVARQSETLAANVGQFGRFLERAGRESGLSGRIQPLADSLVRLILDARGSVERRMGHSDRLAQISTRLDNLGLSLQRLLEQEIDDQAFFVKTGYRSLSDVRPASMLQRSDEREVDLLAALLSFQANQNVAIALARQAWVSPNAAALLTNQDRVAAAITDTRRSMSGLPASLQSQFDPFIAAIEDVYMGASGVLEARRRELDELAAADLILARSRELTASLGAEVDQLIRNAETSIQQSSRSTERIANIGYWLLIVAMLVTIFLAYVSWISFGQPLLSRLSRLFKATRRMSEGDLNTVAEIEGNDELADMGKSLEVFRKHAVEVQRLNLVEQLAAEVQVKNHELEATLDDLKRTQQQVVQQEKLASLGTLTAGVAHEIRNPLNFVKNFSELSEDLLKDLREEIEEGIEDGEMDEELIEELIGDLTTNLGKVQEHGQRANRIVDGMLAHSRGDTGKAADIDINQLVTEYGKLAYHGIRGTDSSFNVNLVWELDSDAGKVEGLAQDLSRVILNIVTNACHATQARRENEADAYSPIVRIGTSGGDDSVKVRIRDNGTGIPSQLIDKIFNPFFTTKSGTQGTGLGLSISNDIVQGHGGNLHVESEVGSFTEFMITLPRKSNLASVVPETTPQN